MSKYKFTVTPLAMRRLSGLMPAMALLLAGLSASDAVFSYLAGWVNYCLAALLVLAGGFIWWRTPHPAPILVLFDGERCWQQACSPPALAEAPVWQLSQRSRLTPWGLYVGFEHNQPGQWILKHEVGQADYRRIARAIQACQPL